MVRVSLVSVISVSCLLSVSGGLANGGQGRAPSGWAPQARVWRRRRRLVDERRRSEYVGAEGAEWTCAAGVSM